MRNDSIKSRDMQLWETYRKTKSPMDKDILLKHFDPIIQKQVNKWAGSIPRNVIEMRAKILAAEAFDTYSPDKGASLATHVVNKMAPISRLVYTNQNAARLPENVTLQLRTFTNAKDHLTTTLGRDPDASELHEVLGWSVNDINKIQNQVRRDLTESVGQLDDSFFNDSDQRADDALAAIYFSLLPEERKLYEYVTGYNGVPELSNPEIMKRMGLTQAQLSYKKSLLRDKIARMGL